MKNNPLTDMNALYEAYKKSVKGSKWKKDSQKFIMNFLPNLVKIKRDIENESYKTEEGTEFKHNERGKIRHIHGASVRDRTVRHCLCDNVLGPCLKPYLADCNGASQKGKGVAFARKCFERDLHNFYLKYRSNDGYVGFVDLSKFYDNIQHDKVKAAVMPKIPEESRWLFHEIVRHFSVDVSYMSDEEYARCMDEKFDSVRYYENVPRTARTGKKYMEKSVEIGDQASQDIGVFFPTPIDNYVKIVRGQKWYGRYMDDMYIIGKDRDEVASIIDGIKDKAKALGLFVNEKKTRIVKLSGVYRFLQIRYSLSDTGKVIKRIGQKSVTRERRKMKAYKRQLDAGKIPLEDIRQAVRSWMGSYARLMSKQQIKHMKDLYRSLFKEELVWKPVLHSKTKPRFSLSRTGIASYWTSLSRSRRI